MELLNILEKYVKKMKFVNLFQTSKVNLTKTLYSILIFCNIS